MVQNWTVAVCDFRSKTKPFFTDELHTDWTIKSIFMISIAKENRNL